MSFSRRALLRSGAIAGAGLVVAPSRAPAFVRQRPQLTHGIQSGDVSADSAIVWTRADRPSRMVVEFSRDPWFRDARRVRGPVLTQESDFTGKLAVRGLPSGRPIHYRVTAEDPWKWGVRSEPLAGSFRTVPWDSRSVSFVWSGDLAGQGWGINPDWGGYRIFDGDGRAGSRLLLCSGDTIYADGPLPESVTLPDGRVWRNLVTPDKAKVAETLDEYRGNFAYNLLDDKLKAFTAKVPQVNQWDDHETRNNWYPGQLFDDPRYTEKERRRARRARAAGVLRVPADPSSAPTGPAGSTAGSPTGRCWICSCSTCAPTRTPTATTAYADPDPRAARPRAAQWLKRELVRSRATWKVIANDLPLGLVVPDGASAQEGVAQGDNGAPLGRELEFADVLGHAQRRGVENVVFVTADVHYTSAHHYDPARAAVGDFDPFWEFVAGPLNAGAFGPMRSTRRSAPRPCSRCRRRAPTRRRWRAFNSSDRWRSTAAARS